ncbi:histidine kinase [Nocardioides sp. BP30]|uniref:sensor histidine kinase n=1 Tax=Nocardioides sp. BP30 TaxID=3036374 RepID=UPI002468FBAC|nr:histidine kinase [Nocardioides sp. BP30]WGL50682.1 histidine kinase [Nocardioides sp. BP30]
MNEERVQGLDVPVGQAFPWASGRRWGAGPWLGAIWLIFMVPALVDGWQARGELHGVIGLIATLSFMALYTLMFVGTDRVRLRMIEQPPLRQALPFIGALVVLGVISTAALGTNATAAAVFVAAAAMMSLPLRITVVLDVAMVAAVIVVGQLQGWPGQGGVALGTLMASLAILGMRTVVRRNVQLWRANEQNTVLAVDNERNRFARDLHDILGHSLTVITVKAELAQRLIEVDAARARVEIADLERLSRDALADIRRAVEGYRELTLPGELARARAALATAEISPHVPQATEIVPTELRELFAWSVREGVTNVIRHSGARRCDILLSESCVEIRDDGHGPCDEHEGSGLTGLRERAAAVGAVVTTRTLSPGFSLQVARP